MGTVDERARPRLRSRAPLCLHRRRGRTQQASDADGTTTTDKEEVISAEEEGSASGRRGPAPAQEAQSLEDRRQGVDRREGCEEGREEGEEEGEVSEPILPQPPVMVSQRGKVIGPQAVPERQDEPGGPLFKSMEDGHGSLPLGSCQARYRGRATSRRDPSPRRTDGPPGSGRRSANDGEAAHGALGGDPNFHP